MVESTDASEPLVEGEPPASILLVDDDRDSRDALQGLLELDGHEVRCAEDGASAMRAVVGFVPDVVILDIHMPRMDGYAVCRHLKEMKALSDTRIFALTALDSAQHVKKCDQAGFDERLTKPMSFDRLRHLLKNLH